MPDDPVVAEAPSTKPQRTALYRHFDERGRLLYVGISLSALHRLAQHEQHSHWFASIARVTIQWHESRAAAMDAERIAIHKEHPEHNIRRPLPTRQQALKMAADRSRAHLTGRIVAFKPIYSIQEVADALNLSTRIVWREIEDGRLGSVEMMAKVRVHRMVTGWQLIDYIEALQAGAG